MPPAPKGRRRGLLPAMQPRIAWIGGTDVCKEYHWFTVEWLLSEAPRHPTSQTRLAESPYKHTGVCGCARDKMDKCKGSDAM